MNISGATLIVVADASEARFYCERVRMGPLTERDGDHMVATDQEHLSGTRHRGDRRWPQHEPERRFLKRVAKQIVRHALSSEFDRLVLVGLPRTIGVLRESLPAEVLSRIDATDGHSRRGEGVAALRRHLSEARLRDAR